MRYNRQRSGDSDFVRDDGEGRGARKFLPSFEAQPAMDCPAASKYSVSLQRVILRLVLPAGLVCVFSIAPNLAAQSPTGPQTPAKAPDVVRIPTTPLPEKAPPIPSEEIIRRFAAQEDEFARARAGYTYRKIVRVEEMGPDGKPTGQAEVTTTTFTGPDGAVSQKASGGQDSTLHILSLERDALESLAQIPAFPLATSQLSKYEITYEGTQPVDELATYVFRVTPKQLDRVHPYFSGLVWVDNHDLAIVKTYGRWVTEIGDISPPQLPFTMYETYRQPVSNKYWLPAYARSDSSESTKNGGVPVRLIIRWEDYQPISGNNALAPAAPANPATSPASAAPANKP